MAFTLVTNLRFNPLILCMCVGVCKTGKRNLKPFFLNPVPCFHYKTSRLTPLSLLRFKHKTTLRSVCNQVIIFCRVLILQFTESPSLFIVESCCFRLHILESFVFVFDQLQVCRLSRSISFSGFCIQQLPSLHVLF